MKQLQLFESRSLRGIIRDAIVVSSKYFRFYTFSFLAFILPLLVPVVIMSVHLVHRFTQLQATMKYGDSPEAGEWTGIIAFYIVVVFIYMVMDMIRTLLVYESILSHERAEDHTVLTVRDMWRYIGQDVYVMIGSVLSLFVLFLLFISVAAGTIVSVSSIQNLGGIVFFIWFVIGIYILTPLSNFYMIRLREQRGVIASVRRCFEIQSGHWWRTLGAILISIMILYFIEILIISVFAIKVSKFVIDALANVPYHNKIYLYMLQGLSYFIFCYFSGYLNYVIAVNYYTLATESADADTQTDDTGMPSDTYTDMGPINETDSGPAFAPSDHDRFLPK